MQLRCSITGPHLEHAHLSGDLFEVLGQCGSLAHLELSSNSSGDEESGRLAGVLGQCESLARLNLGHNSIGAEGVGWLAGVL